MVDKSTYRPEWVKQWRKFRTPENPICSDQELNNLEKKAEMVMEEKANIIEEKIGVYFSLTSISTLPYINGALLTVTMNIQLVP